MVSEYIHSVAHDDQEEPVVRGLAARTWNSLKRSAKAGPRRTVSRHSQQPGAGAPWPGHCGV